MAGRINNGSSLSIGQLQKMQAHKEVKKDGSLAGKIVAAKLVRDGLITTKSSREANVSLPSTTEGRLKLLGAVTGSLEGFAGQMKEYLQNQVKDTQDDGERKRLLENGHKSLNAIIDSSKKTTQAQKSQIKNAVSDMVGKLLTPSSEEAAPSQPPRPVAPKDTRPAIPKDTRPASPSPSIHSEAEGPAPVVDDEMPGPSSPQIQVDVHPAPGPDPDSISLVSIADSIISNPDSVLAELGNLGGAAVTTTREKFGVEGLTGTYTREEVIILKDVFTASFKLDLNGAVSDLTSGGNAPQAKNTVEVGIKALMKTVNEFKALTKGDRLELLTKAYDIYTNLDLSSLDAKFVTAQGKILQNAKETALKAITPQPSPVFDRRADSGSPTPSTGSKISSASSNASSKSKTDSPRSSQEILKNITSRMARYKTNDINDVSHKEVKQLVANYNSYRDEVAYSAVKGFRDQLTLAGFTFNLSGALVAPKGFKPNNAGEYNLNRLLNKLESYDANLATLDMSIAEDKGKRSNKAEQNALEKKRGNTLKEMKEVASSNKAAFQNVVTSLEAQIQSKNKEETREGPEERAKTSAVNALNSRLTTLRSISP